MRKRWGASVARQADNIDRTALLCFNSTRNSAQRDAHNPPPRIAHACPRLSAAAAVDHHHQSLCSLFVTAAAKCSQSHASAKCSQSHTEDKNLPPGQNSIGWGNGSGCAGCRCGKGILTTADLALLLQLACINAVRFDSTSSNWYRPLLYLPFASINEPHGCQTRAQAKAAAPFVARALQPTPCAPIAA